MVCYVQRAIETEQFLHFQITRGGSPGPEIFSSRSFNGIPHPLGQTSSKCFLQRQTGACSAERQQLVCGSAARAVVRTDGHARALSAHRICVLWNSNFMYCLCAKHAFRGQKSWRKGCALPAMLIFDFIPRQIKST